MIYYTIKKEQKYSKNYGLLYENQCNASKLQKRQHGNYKIGNNFIGNFL